MFFLQAEIGDYNKIQKYFSLYGENSCQHSFVNMFTLYEKYGTQYCIQGDTLYLYRSHMDEERHRTYLFPMGGDSRLAVENLLEDAHAHGKKVLFRTITEEKYNWLMREFPGVFEGSEVRDYAEYIHLYENLAFLPGKALKNKRLEAKQVRRNYEGRMEMSLIAKEDLEELLAFEKNWIEEMQEDHDTESLGLEYREMQMQLQYYDELKLSGAVVRIDGVLQGFVYGAPISDDCFDLLVEKGNREIKHICRALEQDMVQMCASDYRYINREEDVGVPGLRNSKLAYKPDILLRKYIAAEK